MLILCDIDGTLFDNTHRAHLLPVNAATTEDWEAFNAAHVDDQPIGYRIGLLNVLAEEHRVIYITGRTETQRATTEQQLEAHGCPAGRLVMREEGNDLWAPELKAFMVRDVLVDYQMWPCDGTGAVIIEDDHRTCERLGREFPAAKIVRVPSACCAYLAREIGHARGVVASRSADVMDRLVEENEQLRARIAELEEAAMMAEAERSAAQVNRDDCEVECSQLRAKLAELEHQAAIGRRAVEMLVGLEWSYGGDAFCPHCAGEPGGHEEGCKLGAILRDAEQAAPEPATVGVDAGALAKLREAMTKLRMLPESALSRPAGAVARWRVMEAARRLLAGGE